MARSRSTRPRALIALAAVAVACLLAFVAPSRGDLHARISSRSAQASALRGQIARESRAIAATAGGVARAQARLSTLRGQVSARRAQLASTQRQLVAARDRLTRLENRAQTATALLMRNLVDAYESDPPQLVTVVLDAHGFSDLLERADFLRKVGDQDAQILHDAKVLRTRVLGQTAQLEGLEGRDQALAAAVVRARDAMAAVQGALLEREAAQLAGRAHEQTALDRVRGQLAGLRTALAKQRAAARAQPVAAAARPGRSAAVAVDPGGLAQAPPGAPEAVRQVIAAGNAIAGLPYVYGGGHGSFQASAYDCSGSVSYALAAAGLVTSPLDSTAFEGWGEAGPGKWITVYANAGHAFMVVAGWRFDTVALASGGTRWTRAMTSTAGFVARHPAGL